MKTIYKDKYIRVDVFTNTYDDKLFSIKFIVDESSIDTYRGWKVKKAAKIAKKLRKIAKKLEKI